MTLRPRAGYGDAMDPLAAISRYLGRHALAAAPDEGQPAPGSGLRLCVVIPALAEGERLPGVLDSLERAASDPAAVEVIVVVNNPADAPAAVVQDNLDSLAVLRARAGRLRVIALDRCSPDRAFAPDQAGVGLARRVGMDLALARLVAAGSPERSAIACLDADSPVGPDYLDTLLAAFDRPAQPLGGVCACRHPIPDDPERAGAILAYEIWMRTFELGLVLAGSPFSYPTIGSCLVASAAGYALADGMPTRQAGEDFYFAQKLIKLSAGRGLTRLDGAVVEPAARASDRVPFGTGRAMLRCASEGVDAYRFMEPAEAFLDLQRWFAAFAPGYADPGALERAAGRRLGAFLRSERAFAALARIRANQPDADRFAFAAHCWFDGLKCVRYAHAVEAELGRQRAFEVLGAILDGLDLAEPFADLAPPRPGDSDLGVHRAWLDRLRAVSPP